MGFGDILKGIVTGASDIIGKFVVDPDKKLAAQQEIVRLQVEWNEKLLQASIEEVKAQAQVVTAEASSGNWLAASWRPILMLTFTYIILHNFVLAPLFHLQSVPIPTDMWDLLRLGIGGYVMGRSAEKIAPSIAQVFQKK